MSTYRNKALVRFLTNRQAKRAYGPDAYSMKRATIIETVMSLPIENADMTQFIPPEEEQPSHMTNTIGSILGTTTIAKEHCEMLAQSCRQPPMMVRRDTQHRTNKFKNTQKNDFVGLTKSNTPETDCETFLAQFEAETVNAQQAENLPEAVNVPEWMTTANFGIPMSSYGGAGVDEPLNKMMCSTAVQDQPSPFVEIKKKVEYQYIEEDDVEAYEKMGYNVYDDVEFNDDGSMYTVYRIIRR